MTPEAALAKLLVQVQECIGALSVMPPSMQGAVDDTWDPDQVQVILKDLTLGQLRAAYPKLHELILGYRVPPWNTEDHWADTEIKPQAPDMPEAEYEESNGVRRWRFPSRQGVRFLIIRQEGNGPYEVYTTRTGRIERLGLKAFPTEAAAMIRAREVWKRWYR